MWSNDNYGCTGHPESFGLLDGNDCSGRHPQLKIIVAANSLPDFSEVVNGTRHPPDLHQL